MVSPRRQPYRNQSAASSSAGERFERLADPVRGCRGGPPDEDGLQRGYERTPLNEAALERSDRRKSESGQDGAPEKGATHPAGEEELAEVGEKRQRSGAHEGDERHEAGTPGRWRPRAHAVLLREHRLDPALSIRRDHVDDAIQVGTRESLGCEDLSDLLALAGGMECDVPCFALADALPELSLRLGAEKGPDRHAEAVGDQVGESEHDHDTARQRGAGRTRHDREGRDDAVDCAVDEVADVAVTGTGLEPRANRGGGMGRLEPLPGALETVLHGPHHDGLGDIRVDGLTPSSPTTARMRNGERPGGMPTVAFPLATRLGFSDGGDGDGTKGGRWGRCDERRGRGAHPPGGIAM